MDIYKLKQISRLYDITTRDKYRIVRKSHKELELPSDDSISKYFGSYSKFKDVLGMKTIRNEKDRWKDEVRKERIFLFGNIIKTKDVVGKVVWIDKDSHNANVILF